MKKIVIVLASALLLLGLSTHALAWGGKAPARPERAMGQEKAWAGLAKQLELTPEQQKKFQTRNEERREKMAAHQQKVKTVADQLRRELKKEPPDRQKIDGLVRRMGELRTDQELQRTADLLEMRRELTPEQRKKFERLLEKKDARRPKRK